MDAKKLLMTAALAGLTLTSCAATATQSKDMSAGKCYGVNACKGHGDCSAKMAANRKAMTVKVTMLARAWDGTKWIRKHVTPKAVSLKVNL